MEKQIVSRLLSEMGELSDVLEISEYEDHWLLVADETSGIFVEPAEDEAIFLWANVAEIPTGTETTVLRLAMQSNGLFLESGGYMLALEGDNNRLQLILKLSLGGLAAAQMATVVANFHHKLTAWRTALDELVSDADPGSFNAGMIRI